MSLHISKPAASNESKPNKLPPVPKVGDKAPVSDLLRFPQPKPTIVVFLRHCGCPFAEKTFKNFTKLSAQHPEVHCVAISHSSQPTTDDWIIQVGGEWEVDVLADPARDLYAEWGLGLTSTWHAYNPWALYSTYRLSRDEGVRGGPQGGSRWQMSGAFAVDVEGRVRWACLPKSADDIPDFADALRALQLGGEGRA